jgi:radical SAM protein (TIGR01212 family)
MAYVYKFNEYLKSAFGAKVWKVPVNAGFTCPNRDGLRGEGGCIYCSVDSFDGAECGDIADQVKSRIEKLKKRKINKYIVYFQSYSNTYGSRETMISRIEESLVDDGVVAVHIGTRPDVIDEEKLAYLKKLNEKYEVVIEYGLQSANDNTLKFINRGHTVQEFIDAVELTHRYGLKVCAHLILGLPNDTVDDMMDSVRLINRLGVHSVKFHHLHVVRDTRLAEMYRAGEVRVLSPEEYAELLAEVLAVLDAGVVVSRLSGDAAGDTLIAPKWDISKGEFEKLLMDRLDEKGLSQGSRS